MANFQTLTSGVNILPLLEAVALEALEPEAVLSTGEFQGYTFLQEILESSQTMIANDKREALLFGAEVTPAKVVSLAAAFIMSAGSVVWEMFKTGEVPSSLADDDGNATHAAVNATASAFLQQLLH